MVNKPATTTKYILSLEARTRSPDSYVAIKLFDTKEDARRYLEGNFTLDEWHEQYGQTHGTVRGERRLYFSIKPIEVLE